MKEYQHFEYIHTVKSEKHANKEKIAIEKCFIFNFLNKIIVN